MSKKNGNKFDSLIKLNGNGVVYRNGAKSIYCNNCGKVHDGEYKKCPDCKSKDVVYVGVDKNE